MKKTKLTRSLLAACSIVALTAVMYGCVHDGGDGPAYSALDLTGYNTADGATVGAGTYDTDDLPPALASALEGYEGPASAGPGESLTIGGYTFTCGADSSCSVTVAPDDSHFTTTGTITVAVAPPPPVNVAMPDYIPEGLAPTAGEYVVRAGDFAGSNGVYFYCPEDGPDCTITIHADGSATRSAGSGMIEVGLTSDAQVLADAKMAKDQRIANQKMALMTAAGNVDTSDLSTAEDVAAANNAIAMLQAALDAAVDVSDADKAMYQSQLESARMAVATAQGNLDTQGRMMAQRTAISNAVSAARTAVGMVNDSATEAQVMAADNAIAALQMAIDGADDLSEGDADVVGAQATLDTLTGQLSTAKTSRTAAMNAEERKRQSPPILPLSLI